jgi:hypothetical protein
MTSMLDLMPAPGLIFNEWDKHGTCSGLARGPISRPSARPRRGEDSAEYLELSAPKTDAPGAIEEAFIKVNPGLEQFGDLGDLRQPAAQRSAYLPEQGPAVPRLRGDRPPRLPPRRGGDAADAGRVEPAVIPEAATNIRSSCSRPE